MDYDSFNLMPLLQQPHHAHHTQLYSVYPMALFVPELVKGGLAMHILTIGNLFTIINGAVRYPLWHMRLDITSTWGTLGRVLQNMAIRVDL